MFFGVRDNARDKTVAEKGAFGVDKHGGGYSVRFVFKSFRNIKIKKAIHTEPSRNILFRNGGDGYREILKIMLNFACFI